MKKIILLLIIFLHNVIFATFTLENYTVTSSPLGVVIDSSERGSKFDAIYDEDNRVLMLEFPNAVAGKNFKSKYFGGQSIKEITIKQHEDETLMFIEFQKNIKYSIRTNKSSDKINILLTKDNSKKDYTIAIDAGHGGKDSGAVGYGVREKDIALKIARLLRDRLSNDFNVIMTRDSDTFVSLAERPNKANKAKADLFVSIHLNSASNAGANGVEIFYFSKNASEYAKRIASYENSFGSKYGEKVDDITLIMGDILYKRYQEISMGLANQMVNSYAKGVGFTNRGSHGANFAVLRGFNGPGMLVEVGFISNKNENSKLVSSSYQSKIADNLAGNIRKYFY